MEEQTEKAPQIFFLEYVPDERMVLDDLPYDFCGKTIARFGKLMEHAQADREQPWTFFELNTKEAETLEILAAWMTGMARLARLDNLDTGAIAYIAMPRGIPWELKQG